MATYRKTKSGSFQIDFREAGKRVRITVSCEESAKTLIKEVKKRQSMVKLRSHFGHNLDKSAPVLEPTGAIKKPPAGGDPPRRVEIQRRVEDSNLHRANAPAD